MSRQKKKNIFPSLLVVIGIVLIVIAIATRILPIIMPAKVTIITSETLKEKIKISELATAKFTYNGIAEYKRDDKEICKILYHAYVKPVINAENIDFEVDNDKKTIKPLLPEIKDYMSYVDETESELKFSPANPDVNLSDAIKACREDALNKALANDKFKSTAKGNFEKNIERIIYPLAKPEGYTIVWE